MIHKNILKSYAPDARREFIKVVTERAAFYGITEKKVFPCEIKGDFAFISGKAFPKDIDKKRNDLIKRVEKAGFDQTMEEIAYTWFNRFMAIRFMEVNGCLSHGYRVLSHPAGNNEPEILEKAQFIAKLDGLEKDEIIKLKTAAGKESELYRRLIIAQCNDLSAAMPFLFERVDDPTELLLPDNLLNTDSVVRKMVSSIPEEDWKEVEIVGWLYQFYIAEKKDELMKAKKAYKTEEIPAVTQLFTPKWIVKYLVQNSLGAKWLATYPKSGLKQKMEYYIPPAEQSEEVKAKIKEITPGSLNPEELTVMDPACGSGHILVEAYDILKEIYLERGYRARDIAGLILTKNLFGLEIDVRAAQLAGFALLMKAYADDREIFKKGIKSNIICLKSGDGAGAHFKEAKQLIELFENATTFGSLIRIPEDLQKKLITIEKVLEKKKTGDIFEQKDAEVVEVLLKQAESLSKRYDCVIANPPYMGGKWMNTTLKEFANTQYPTTKSDLFAMFIERGFEMAKENIGYNAMVTMQSWMFLSSFEKCRELWIDTMTIQSMAHLGARAFSTISGEIVTVTAFSFLNCHLQEYKPSFLRLVDGNEEQKLNGLKNKENLFKSAIQNDFKKIPGSPIAYWLSEKIKNIFKEGKNIESNASVCIGMKTGDNEVFVKRWHEVSYCKIGFYLEDLEIANKSDYIWFPYLKGGDFRKWYGDCELILNWINGGDNVKNHVNDSGISDSRIRPSNYDYYFKRGIDWSFTGSFGVRIHDKGCFFDVAGSSLFPHKSNDIEIFAGLLNSVLSKVLLKAINPTLSTQIENVKTIPFSDFTESKARQIKGVIEELYLISKTDWDSFETSWDFGQLSIISYKLSSLGESYSVFRQKCHDMTVKMKALEEENNRIFIEAYGLQDELTPGVPIEEITLFANTKYRYKGELTADELDVRFKADTMKELLSYAVGCMMGRYSLDVMGLVYAHAENKGFDLKKYKTFPADEDGIIPITEREWFDDDVACRFFRFTEIAWDKKGLDENLDFIADAIGRRSGESSRDAIRKYFLNDFYKDHCQTYKNRPIYWLFTSGKEKAFQALVYLHRYNEGTLARMRTEYVLPLQTKIMRHIEHLEKDKDAASGSTANKIQKEIVALQKQQAELSKFDERLRHYADMKIKLDLDEGVKANYGKFGELLEPIKGLKYGSEED